MIIFFAIAITPVPVLQANVLIASDWNTIVAKVIPWKRVADKLGRGNFFKFKISSL